MHESPSRERLRSARAVQFVPTFESWCGVDGSGIAARMQQLDSPRICRLGVRLLWGTLACESVKPVTSCRVRVFFCLEVSI
jgi:hypothetical protein